MPTWNAYTRSPACHHTSRMFHAFPLSLSISSPSLFNSLLHSLLSSSSFSPFIPTSRILAFLDVLLSFSSSHVRLFAALPCPTPKNLFLYFLPQPLPFAIISTDTSPTLPRATYGIPRGELAASFYSARASMSAGECRYRKLGGRYNDGISRRRY